MKAIRFHRYGDADELRVEDVDDPTPGEGEVRLRVAASAFNPVDAGIRGGWVREAFPIELPHTPGYDVSGIVDLVGDGVEGLAVGDRVVGFLSMTAQGAAAQHVVAPAADLVAAPTSVDLVDAAALPSVGTTAWQALFDAADVRTGQRVLVNGAGGAVGRTAVQLAARAGATVVAVTTASSAEVARRYGAAQVVDHAAGPVDVGEPVDVVLNLGTVDAETMRHLTAQVRPGGVVVNTVPSVANPGNAERGVRAVGFFVHSDVDVLGRLVGLVDEGSLEIAVDERVGLDQLASVHQRSDAGTLRTKVVVVPPPF